MQEKPWREALRLAANEIDPKTKQRRLRQVAQALVNAAIAGDVQAAKEIGDRLDGKAVQAIEAGLNGELNIIVATGVPRADD